MKYNHAELIERLQNLDTLDLLYLLAEAKAGKHVDILKALPDDVVEAEAAVNKLVRLCGTIEN